MNSMKSSNMNSDGNNTLLIIAIITVVISAFALVVTYNNLFNLQQILLSPQDTGAFDRVLLDAPCSGFGSLRRNPDIKWRRHPKDPVRFARLQKQLLDHAARLSLYQQAENQNVAELYARLEHDINYPDRSTQVRLRELCQRIIAIA